MINMKSRQNLCRGNGGVMEDGDYTYAPDHKVTAEELERFRRGAEYMRTMGLLTENYKSETDKNMQNSAIMAAVVSGKTTVAEIKAIKGLAKKAGLKVRFESMPEKSGRVVNGSFADGVITVNVRGADAFSRTAVHELIHYFALNNAVKYGEIKAAIEAVCAENAELKKVYDSAVKTYREAVPGKSEDYYAEDAVCKVAERFISEYGKGESGKLDLSRVDKKHIRTLRDFFRALRERIRQFKVQKANDTTDKVIAVLDKALRSESKVEAKTEKGDGDVKLSLQKLPNGTEYVFVDVGQDVFDNAPETDYPKIAKSEILSKFRNKILSLGEGSNAFVNRNSANEYAYPANQRMDIQVKEAKMRASTELDNLLKASKFLEWAADDGRHPDAVRGWDTYLTLFKVADKYFEGQAKIKKIAKGDLFYDITKIKDVTERTFGSMDKSKSESPETSSTTNYAQKSENVNTSEEKNSFALSADSEGRTLTKEQAEFFKDSKVRDDKGNLQVVYHFTNDTINRINFQKGAQGLFWFTTDKNSLKDGTISATGLRPNKEIKTMELYANIKNPAGWTEYDKYGIDELRWRGYDGAILEDGEKKVGFVFDNPSQIKLTTNKNPTASEDIRYSYGKSKNTDIDNEYKTLYNAFAKGLEENKDGKGTRRFGGYDDGKWEISKRTSERIERLGKISGYIETRDGREFYKNIVEAAKGIKNYRVGNLSANFIKQEFLTPYLKDLIQDNADAYGFSTHFYIGVPTIGGEVRPFNNGYSYKDNICVRLDYNDLTIKQLMRHERFHSINRITTEDYMNGIRHIVSSLLKWDYSSLMSEYGDRWGYSNDKLILNEIACNVYAGIEKLPDYAQPFADRLIAELDKTYGTKYSLETETEAESKVLLDVPSIEKTGKLASAKESAIDKNIQFLISWVNAQAGIEKYAKTLGITGMEAYTNYARAARSAADYKIEKELRPLFEKIRKPTKDKEFNKQYATHFMAYLLHWHNTDRMAEGVGKEVFGTEVGVEESREAISRYDGVHPEFKKYAEEVWAYGRGLLTMQLEYGEISQELYDSLVERYPHYVPTYRDSGVGQTVGAVKGKGFIEINRSLKTAKGSDLPILPVDIMLARRTMQVYGSVRINDVAKRLYENAAAKGDDTRVKLAGRERIEDVTDYNKYRPKHNQITFFENGEAVTLAVSRDIFTGFEAFSPDSNSEWNNPVMNFTRKWNTVFKKLVTAYNPFFLIRNGFRDLQDAGLYTKYGWSKFVKNLGLAYEQIAHNGKYWREYREAGGLNSSVFDYERGYKNTPKGFRKALGALEAANLVVEQAPRLAEFISSRQAGVGVEQALLNAADVTVNFGRGGTFAKKLNSSVIPFLNPSIQGFDKLMRTVFGKKTAKEWGRLIVRAFVLGIGVSILNDLLLGDDDEYKQLRQSDKENYYILKIGEGRFIKIPKGRVNASISQVYYMTKQAITGEKVKLKDEFTTLRSNLSPTDALGRFVWSPFTDVASNKTWYGTDIESAKFQNSAPRDRYDEYTSVIAIKLGKLLNYSPKKLNYLLDQYSGFIGDVLLPVTTRAADKNVLEASFVLDSTTQNGISREFYDELDNARWAADGGDLLAAGKLKYLNKVKSKTSELNKRKQEIQNSDLKDKEKRAEIKALQVLINNMQKSALTNLDIFEEELAGYALTEDTFDASYLQAYRRTFGAELAFEQYNKNAYGKASLMNGIGIGYETYFDAYFTLGAMEADKDRRGNPVAGSRKKKIVQYVNGLKSLSKVQKAVLMASAGLSLSDGLKAQVRSLARTLPEEQRIALYTLCKIKSNTTKAA